MEKAAILLRHTRAQVLVTPMPAFLVAIPLVEHRARLVSLVAGFVESVVADVRLAGAVIGAAASVVGGHDGCIAGWVGKCV